MIDPVLLPGTASRSVEEDWVDLVIGARWINPISEKWSFLLKGDIGGGGRISPLPVTSGSATNWASRQNLTCVTRRW